MKKDRSITIHMYFIIALLAFLVIAIATLLFTDKRESFKFKTITTNCSSFNITAFLGYDKINNNLYISNINYCGGNNKIIYDNISGKLYEKPENEISSFSSSKKTNIEDYLKELALNLSSYKEKCTSYTDESLYLELTATSGKDTDNYIIPLRLNNTCPR